MRLVSIGEAMIELCPTEQAHWQLGVAGDTLNTAWYARECLPHDWTVDYVTRVGRDPFSDRIVDFIARAGIGTAHIGRDAALGPGLYAISLEDGERSFTYWRGQSAARHLADDEAALGAALDGAAMAYLSGITLGILTPDRRAALLERIALAAVPLAFDPNYRPALWSGPEEARDWASRAAAQAAIVLPSADDEAALFGDETPEATRARYAAICPGEVIVKNGGGPVFYHAGEAGVLTGLPRRELVDSTGAGDSFNAGFLAARLTGMDPVSAIEEGHHLAMRVVGGRGAMVHPDD